MSPGPSVSRCCQAPRCAGPTTENVAAESGEAVTRARTDEASADTTSALTTGAATSARASAGRARAPPCHRPNLLRAGAERSRFSTAPTRLQPASERVSRSARVSAASALLLSATHTTFGRLSARKRVSDTEAGGSSTRTTTFSIERQTSSADRHCLRFSGFHAPAGSASSATDGASAPERRSAIRVGAFKRSSSWDARSSAERGASGDEGDFPRRAGPAGFRAEIVSTRQPHATAPWARRPTSVERPSLPWAEVKPQTAPLPGTLPSRRWREVHVRKAHWSVSAADMRLRSPSVASRGRPVTRSTSVRVFTRLSKSSARTMAAHEKMNPKNAPRRPQRTMSIRVERAARRAPPSRALAR